MYLAFASLFVISLGYGVEIPQLPELVGRENATAGLLSLLFVSYSTTKILLQIPAGVWIDRSSPVHALRLALALNACYVCIFIATKEPVLLVFARALGGAAAALTFPATFAAVVSDDRMSLGKRMGMVGSAAAFGMLSGFALAGSMATAFGPRSPLVVVAVASLGLLVVLMLRETEARVPAAPSEKQSLKHELTILWKRARVPAFVGLILPVAFNKLSFTGIQSTLPLIGPKEFALGTTGVSALFGATGILFGISQVASGAAVDRFRSLSAPTVIGLGLMASLLACALSVSLGGFTAAFCGYILCSSFVFAWTMRTLAVRSDEDSYARNFGVFATLTDLMTIAGPPLALWLYASEGRNAFAVLAVIAVPFYVVFILLQRASGTETD